MQGNEQGTARIFEGERLATGLPDFSESRDFHGQQKPAQCARSFIPHPSFTVMFYFIPHPSFTHTNTQ